MNESGYDPMARRAQFVDALAGKSAPESPRPSVIQELEVLRSHMSDTLKTAEVLGERLSPLRAEPPKTAGHAGVAVGPATQDSTLVYFIREIQLQASAINRVLRDIEATLQL